MKIRSLLLTAAGLVALLASTLALITLATLIAMGTAFVLTVAVAVAGIGQQRRGACNQRQAGKYG